MQIDTFNPNALDTQTYNASRQQQALQLRAEGSNSIAEEAQAQQTVPTSGAQPQATQSAQVQISDAARQAAANDAPGSAPQNNNPATAQQQSAATAASAPRHHGIEMFEQTAAMNHQATGASVALRSS